MLIYIAAQKQAQLYMYYELRSSNIFTCTPYMHVHWTLPPLTNRLPLWCSNQREEKFSPKTRNKMVDGDPVVSASSWSQEQLDWVKMISMVTAQSGCDKSSRCRGACQFVREMNSNIVTVDSWCW